MPTKVIKSKDVISDEENRRHKRGDQKPNKQLSFSTFSFNLIKLETKNDISRNESSIGVIYSFESLPNS